MVDVPAPVLFAALLVFAAVSLGVLSLVLGGEWLAQRRRRAEFEKQLERLDHDLAATPVGGKGILRGAADESPWMRAAGERIPQLRDFEHLLAQSGVQMRVQGLLIATVGLALAFGLAAMVVAGFGIASLVAAAAGAALPYLYVAIARRRRMFAFESQLPGAVDLMGRSLRAGHPLTSGLKMVADESQDPLAGEFRQVFEEQRFGMPFEDSLVALADRVPLVDVRILVTAVLVQREVGGNLAEILDKIAYVIRERFTIRRQLRVITAEGRMSMWVLMGLPVGVGLMIYSMNPEYILTLFRDPLGHRMLWAALAMNFVGFLWIRKIVQIEI